MERVKRGDMHTGLQVAQEFQGVPPLIRQCCRFSSLPLGWLDCIRRLVTTCSAELLQAVQRPGLASGHREIALRDMETCSGATMSCSKILLLQWIACSSRCS